jgi:succinyl-diaminopimelate desuccinylase
MKDTIESISKRLIEMPSVSGDVEQSIKILEYVKSYLHGFEFHSFSSDSIPSLLFRNKTKDEKKFRIILNAHLDIVPAGDVQFHPIIKNGKLFARGAYDMKAAAAVMIFVFSEIAKQVSYPLGLQLVTDEEIGGMNGTKYQLDKGVSSEFVIAGENTNLKINNKAKGVLWLKLHTKGIAAHGAYPWNGKNALLILYDALNALFLLFPVSQKENWRTTLNLAKIETSNNAFNKIPDNATAFLDIRYIPEEKELILETIKKALPEGTETEIVTFGAAQFTRENNPFVLRLKKQIEKIAKSETEMVALPGASDVRFYEEKGCPSVCFGPIGGNHHAEDEWVDLESLESYYHILKNFLLEKE